MHIQQHPEFGAALFCAPKLYLVRSYADLLPGGMADKLLKDAQAAAKAGQPFALSLPASDPACFLLELMRWRRVHDSMCRAGCPKIA